MEKVFIAATATVGIVIFMASIGLLLAFPIKWTWNAVIPYLFGWPVLTWGKAWCLNFICGCLIKSNHINTR